MEKAVFHCLFLGLICVSASYQIELNCKFGRVGWDDVVQPAFTCTAQNLNLTTPKTQITMLTGNLPDGETLDKVNTFLVFEQNCEYFPVGIHNFLRKLEGLAIQKSGLKKITKADLKPFKLLKSISLYGNKLISLESRLFVYNTNLQIISLFSNKLQHVSPKIFEGLDNLNRVFITFNPCINLNAEKKEDIEKIKTAVAENCPVTSEMADFALLEEEKFNLEFELRKSEENLKALARTMLRAQKQIEKLEEDFKVQGTSNESYQCATELRYCEVENFDLMELVKDMRIVEIICERGNQTEKCNSLNLKVLSPRISVVNVRLNDKSIPNLNEINELVIEHQQTLHLPMNLSEFVPNLKIISLTDSGLITIDKDAFKGLNSLYDVNFSNNKLTGIDSANFEHAKRILKLDLSRNLIAEIELSSFNELKDLKELRLNNNLLTTLLSGMFSKNKNLEILTLNSNKLSQIASNFLDLSRNNLHFVDLTENVCIDQKLPDSNANQIYQSLVKSCPVEMEIECEFEQEEQYVCSAKNLEITSENMRLVGLKGDHAQGKLNDDVMVLRINKQLTEFMPTNLGSVIRNLESLSVENSGLKEVKQEHFVGLVNLKELKIKDNCLTDINVDSFDLLPRLEILDLSQNQISVFNESFTSPLKNLQVLNLSHNKLTKLTANLIQPKNSIKKLICSHNLLTLIDPQIIKRLKLSTVIDFESNSCIDSKYDKSTNQQNKKLMELFGELSFKCTDA